MSLWVKLCGMRTPADVEAAIASGADAIGIVLSPSVRMVDLKTANRLVAEASDAITSVAVFFQPTAEEVLAAHSQVGFGMYQAEAGHLQTLTDLPLLPVVHDSPDLVPDIDAARRLTTTRLVLVESAGKGGHGKGPDRERFGGIPETGDVVLAGGLTPENVGAAVRDFELAGVDVSSGIERSRGEKDHQSMKRFVKNVRTAEEERR